MTETTQTSPAIAPAFEELMIIRGQGAAPAGEAAVQGRDPFHPTPLRVGDTTAAVLAAVGVAANDVWQQRAGKRQQVRVSQRHAAATVRTVDYTRARNAAGAYEHVQIPQAMAHMLTVTQPWPTRDGRWFLPHLNLPHLSQRVLDVLKCDSTPEAVRAAVASRDADALEEAIAAARACGGTIRSAEEWLAHPQGRYLAGRPVVEVDRVGTAPAPAWLPLPAAGARPLSGVRVLDLTRILAGPVGGRTLAELGADVLMVTSDHLPQTPEHVRDTSHGKRSCFLDLRRPADAERLRALVAEADVLVNGYRPGRIASLGFDENTLWRLNPGLVQVQVSCYGSGGPWADRAGWEQVAQAVSGVCDTQGRLTGAGQPKLVFAPVCDYTTGYLTAYGALLALGRRGREGGGWRVHTALCGAAMLVQRQGLVEGFAEATGKLTEQELAPLLVQESGSYGELRTLGPALQLSETPPHWDKPTPRLGGDRPEWLPR
ncbi:CoA transferase [Ramlibacter sp.]|uniref:CoA transferase n=1 Tax=Ramlibacter sp. TaxID=1917967 RepID=UPI00262C3B90|nr:CoA transferase [Ramlibacter sp.]MDB5954807.1 acyl-CoA transferase [Ramlibacter sp.]